MIEDIKKYTLTTLLNKCQVTNLYKVIKIV